MYFFVVERANIAIYLRYKERIIKKLFGHSLL
jgi:hypothetical protein